MLVMHATKEDRDEFLRLWRDYLKEVSDMGGDILPTDRSMLYFGMLFDAYVSGVLRGAVVLLVDVETTRAYGVVMWGMLTDEPLVDSRFGVTASAFGSYVEPKFRGHGYSADMRRMAAKFIKAAGIDAVQSVIDEGGFDEIFISQVSSKMRDQAIVDAIADVIEGAGK